MLSDQGLPNTPEQRSLLSNATFLPVRLYGALLSGEIQFLRNDGTRPAGLKGEEVSEALEPHGALVESLRLFRGRLLHPNPDSDIADHELVRAGLFHQMTALQHDVDRLIEVARHRVRIRVESLLDQLPEEQVLVCRWLHLKECVDHPVLFQDEDALAQLAAEASEVDAQLSEHGNVDGLADPSDQERRKARKIARWLTGTLPVSTAQHRPDLDIAQPPMDIHLAQRFIRPRKTPPAATLGGQEALDIAANWRGYAQWLLTVAVLLNETRQHVVKVFPQGVVDEHQSSTIVATLREAAPAEFVRLVALGRVSFALLAPLLFSYERVQSENPGLAIAALDSLVGAPDAFPRYRKFRNTVFHVQRAAEDPERLDASLLDLCPDDNLVEALYQGCSEFLSWFAPPVRDA